MSVVDAGRIGTPFHGEVKDSGSGWELHLPNGTTMSWPFSTAHLYGCIKLLAPDAPDAPAATAADVAAGREWRNYTLYHSLGSDLYDIPATRPVVAAAATDGIKFAWYWHPTFGTVYRVWLEKSGNNFTLNAQRAGLINADAAPIIEIDAFVFTGTYQFQDIAQGAGDRTLWLKSGAGLIEWTLSYTVDEDGSVTLGYTESVIDGALSSNSNTTPPNEYTPRQDTLWSETQHFVDCLSEAGGGTPSTTSLSTFDNVLYTVDQEGVDPYEYHVNLSAHVPYPKVRTISSQSNILTGGIYQNGVAKSLRTISSNSTTSGYTVMRTAAGAWHYDWIPDHQYCHEQELIEDVPESSTVTLTYTESTTATSEFQVGGTVIRQTSYTETTDSELTLTYGEEGPSPSIPLPDGVIRFWDTTTTTSTGIQESLKTKVASSIPRVLLVYKGAETSATILHAYGESIGSIDDYYSLDHASGGISARAYPHLWA